MKRGFTPYQYTHSIFWYEIWYDNLFVGVLFLLIHFPFLSNQHDIMPLARESSESCAVALPVWEPGNTASADMAHAESSCSEGRGADLKTAAP